jgi:hypothetical protein
MYNSFYILTPLTMYKTVSLYFFGRMALAAMHYNENANRHQATTAEGLEQYSLTFPKNKDGKLTVRALKTQPTYGNVIYLIISF